MRLPAAEAAPVVRQPGPECPQECRAPRGRTPPPGTGTVQRLPAARVAELPMKPSIRADPLAPASPAPALDQRRRPTRDRTRRQEGTHPRAPRVLLRRDRSAIHEPSPMTDAPSKTARMADRAPLRRHPTPGRGYAARPTSGVVLVSATYV